MRTFRADWHLALRGLRGDEHQQVERVLEMQIAARPGGFGTRCHPTIARGRTRMKGGLSHGGCSAIRALRIVVLIGMGFC